MGKHFKKNQKSLPQDVYCRKCERPIMRQTIVFCSQSTKTMFKFKCQQGSCKQTIRFRKEGGAWILKSGAWNHEEWEARLLNCGPSSRLSDLNPQTQSTVDKMMGSDNREVVPLAVTNYGDNPTKGSDIDPAVIQSIVEKMMDLDPQTQSTMEKMMGCAIDPLSAVCKSIAPGVIREAVQLGVANYGDNPTKVSKFVDGYTLLREHGFLSTYISEALVMCDNDPDQALSLLLDSSS